MDSTHANVLPLLSRQLMLKREYKLVTGERYLFETQNEFHKSSCASVYLQCGPQDDRSNVFIDLVTQILSEPCYNQLRTKVSFAIHFSTKVRALFGSTMRTREPKRILAALQFLMFCKLYYFLGTIRLHSLLWCSKS